MRKSRQLWIDQDLVSTWLPPPLYFDSSASVERILSFYWNHDVGCVPKAVYPSQGTRRLSIPQHVEFRRDEGIFSAPHPPPMNQRSDVSPRTTRPIHAHHGPRRGPRVRAFSRSRVVGVGGLRVPLGRGEDDILQTGTRKSKACARVLASGEEPTHTDPFTSNSRRKG